MVKKKYVPFGNDLNVEVALVQAAQMLDHAGAWAVENSDPSMMTNVSGGWMELSARLAGYAEEEQQREEELELTSRPDYQIGFQPNAHDDEESDEDDEDLEEDE